MIIRILPKPNIIQIPSIPNTHPPHSTTTTPTPTAATEPPSFSKSTKLRNSNKPTSRTRAQSAYIAPNTLMKQSIPEDSEVNQNTSQFFMNHHTPISDQIFFDPRDEEDLRLNLNPNQQQPHPISQNQHQHQRHHKMLQNVEDKFSKVSINEHYDLDNNSKPEIENQDQNSPTQTKSRQATLVSDTSTTQRTQIPAQNSTLIKNISYKSSNSEILNSLPVSKSFDETASYISSQGTNRQMTSSANFQRPNIKTQSLPQQVSKNLKCEGPVASSAVSDHGLPMSLVPASESPTAASNLLAMIPHVSVNAAQNASKNSNVHRINSNPISMNSQSSVDELPNSSNLVEHVNLPSSIYKSENLSMIEDMEEDSMRQEDDEMNAIDL